MSVLIIAEKPSQARNFAAALGGQKGTYNGESYIIAPLRGHLYEFVEPSKQVAKSLEEQYKSWKLQYLPWNDKDFAWKRTKKKDTASVINNIKALAKTVDEVCVATDNDPTGEGQLLAFEVLLENNIKAKKFSRMWFADESKAEVQKAFKTRTTISDLLSDPDYKKALFRSKWDFLSIQWSRIATMCGDGRSVLRQGRLKSAMVKIVGDQLAAVAAYKKVPFYGNRFRDENGNVFVNPDEPVFKTKAEVPGGYTDSAVIVDSKTMKKTPPAKLIDLATLSAALAPKGIKAKDVLATYQKLYESAQVVSYPRTEDKCITVEQFNDLLPKIDAIAKLVGVDTALLTHRTPRATHVKTGMAHGANRPGLNVPKSLSDLDKYGPGAQEIYVMLAKNYLAMLAEDYEYESQKGHLEKYPAFTATANVPVKAGWHAVSYDATDDDDVSGKALGKMAKPFIHEGFPPKPAAPTMKWLFKQLEKRDVGTGATRTSIYAEVTNDKAKYPLLSEKRGKIDMTQYGDMSYGLLPNTHIGDLGITENLMKVMRDIAAGKANADAELAKVKDLIKDDIETMKANGSKLRKDKGIMADFVEKEKYEGVWNGRPVKFTREWGGHRFSDEECEKLCAGEEITINGLISKKGTTYGIVGQLSEQEYNGRKYVGFERTGFASTNEVPAKWCEHEFTAAEKKALEAGETVFIEGAISKKGNTFDVEVSYGKTESGRMGIIPHFN